MWDAADRILAAGRRAGWDRGPDDDGAGSGPDLGPDVELGAGGGGGGGGWEAGQGGEAFRAIAEAMVSDGGSEERGRIEGDYMYVCICIYVYIKYWR
jgi:hypothetical protein